MIFGALDLETAERNAWQRGDYVLAEALALAIDAENSEAEVTELRDLLDDIREMVTKSCWRTGKKAELRELVEDIVNRLAEAR